MCVYLKRCQCSALQLNAALFGLRRMGSVSVSNNAKEADETSPAGISCKSPTLGYMLILYEEHFPPRFPRKVLAEAIATFLLVFVTCGSAALSASNEHTVSKLGASVAGGLIVTVMIYAVGHVSGAHMNPAVTLAFAAVRRFPWKQVPFYWVAQLMGSAIASFTLVLLLHPITNVGTTTPSGSDFQALVMEIVVTFTMMFVTSAVATDTKAVGELAGIAVGSAVTITSILAGPISGGSMNPARSLGPAIASKIYKGVWVYILGPVVGTLLGAWSYSLIRMSDKHLHSPVSSLSSSWRSISHKRSRESQSAEEETDIP